MNITLHIPDSVARSLRIPEAEAEERLRQELAAVLYARGLLSFGQASEHESLRLLRGPDPAADCPALRA
jgi:hypothetical protein